MQDNDDDRTQTHLVLNAGAEIANYRIINKIGQGGMGEVYLAEDTDLSRKAALKFLPSSLASDTNFRSRFSREARAAAKLNHPNIVTIYGIAEHGGHMYIAMEYVLGRSLQEIIESGPPNLAGCLAIISQICNGLASAHKAKLVHRDIKPSNIMIDGEQRVRILDFGLAKGRDDERLTLAGETLGTVHYMSPEQSQGKQVDHRSDIFSTGVVAYELLTGLLPFKKENIPATLHAIVHDPHPPLSDNLASAPTRLGEILDRALAKDPGDRYQNLDELVADLNGIMGNTTATVAADSTPVPRKAIPSLAVLQLRNLGSPDDEFLAYGITEDLIVDLTRIGAIRVASMRSVLRFSKSDADLDEIAQKLNVALILDGSIHRTESLIRISVQLVDTATGQNVWAERWEKPFDQLPWIKRHLADGITGSLVIGDTIVRRAHIGAHEVQNATAYENYLRGKYVFDHKKNRADVDAALELYQRALEQESDLLAARAGTAELYIYLGDFDNARKELVVALDNADERGLRAEKGQLLFHLAQYSFKRSNWDKTHKYGSEAIKIKQELNDRAGEAEVLGIMIRAAQVQGDHDLAISMYDRILQIARHLEDKERIAEALKSTGVVYARKGEFDRALDLYDEALELARAADNLSLQAACWSNIGNVFFFRGDLDKAYEKYDGAYDIESRLGDKAGMARHTLNKGLVQFRLGDYERGVKLLHKSSVDFRELNDQNMLAMALMNTSQAQLMVGEVDKAIENAVEALQIARDLKHPLAESDAAIRLASAYLYQHDFAQATSFFSQALETASGAQISRNVTNAHIGLAEIALYQDDTSEGGNHVRMGLEVARAIGERSMIVKLKALEGMVTARGGLANAGIHQLQRVLEESQEIGDTALTLEIQIHLGRVLLEFGSSEDDKQEGRELLQSTLESAREKKLAVQIQLAEETLKEL